MASISTGMPSEAPTLLSFVLCTDGSTQATFADRTVVLLNKGDVPANITVFIAKSVGQCRSKTARARETSA